MTRLLALLVATATPVFADGGTILLHQETRPFVITVFASPTPPRVGAMDMSVLVQSSETLDPVLDAGVRIALTTGDSHLEVPATHNQAQNKLLYAVSVPLNAPGQWHYSLSITRAGESTPITASGDITVASEQPKLLSYWTWLTLPFLSLMVLSLHQWLRFGRRASPAAKPRPGD